MSVVHLVDVIYATVHCCRDWPIIFSADGEVFGWRKCGLCGEKPEMVEIHWPERFRSST